VALNFVVRGRIKAISQLGPQGFVLFGNLVDNMPRPTNSLKTHLPLFLGKGDSDIE
jgi:hypothetical protein